MLSSFYSTSLVGTPYISDVVNDFLSNHPRLADLQQYVHDDIPTIIAERKKSPSQRSVLQEIVTKQNTPYLASFPQIKNNIDALASENTFTICTAHQPHIALGATYVLYKTIHIIQLARAWKQQHPAFDFVPIFFIGSEDSDKGELLSIDVYGKKYRYQTRQQGAVGRMQTDEWQQFSKLIFSTLNDYPFAQEAQQILDDAYSQASFAAAFRHILTHLFGKEGLVILDIDDAQVKQVCLPIFEQEINTQQSIHLIKKTTDHLDKMYGTHQLTVDGTNLFHLADGVRKKIKALDNTFIHPHFSHPITATEYIDYIHENPTSISPNAALRPLVQEYILPNIAFVGGPAEVAYWLQLKSMFDYFGIHYPLIQLRQSFTFLDKHQSTLFNALQLNECFFTRHFSWKDYVEQGDLEQFTSLHDKAHILSSMQQYHQSLQHLGFADTKALESWEARAASFYRSIEKRMLQRLKKKHRAILVEDLHTSLFPMQKLQERTMSFAAFYAMFGQAGISALMDVDIAWTKPSLTIIAAI